MNKLLLLATSATAYYLFRNRQNKQKQQKKRKNLLKTVNTQNKTNDDSKTPLKNDNFTLSGEYRWTFYLGPIKQVSTHIFTNDYIDYRIHGKAHTEKYRLLKLSYDSEQHKWFGKTDDDLVYVLFFKTDNNNSDEKIIIYKHKCGYGDKGIAEATAFAYPAEDATADHGWNVYSKEGSNEPQDILPFSGEFVATNTNNNNASSSSDDNSSNSLEKISIADSQVTWSGKTYKKLTHHTGERRWVGQLDDEYLILFYELNEKNETNETPLISIALKTFNDFEKAYKSKHAEQHYVDFTMVNKKESIMTKNSEIDTSTLICYKSMPEWNNDTVPKGFRNKHNTKAGTWAKLTVLKGKLQYDAMDEAGEITDTVVFDKDSDIPFVEPQAWHKVTPLTDDMRCQLSFYCLPADYYQKKYSISSTHSEVIETLQIMKKDGVDINGLSALDLGCGGGRNSLYLQSHGFDVNAMDKNEDSIGKFQNIIEQEKLEHISANVANLHKTDELGIEKEYDLAISTVVLMFLDADKVPAVIDTMQKNTKVGGYNTIVCAMDSKDYPYSNYQGLLPFQFGFKPNELSDYYKDWDIVKYNEEVGHLHRIDSEGNPIALRFATLIAKKIAK